MFSRNISTFYLLHQAEKEELQAALEEAEGALEHMESNEEYTELDKQNRQQKYDWLDDENLPEVKV